MEVWYEIHEYDHGRNSNPEAWRKRHAIEFKTLEDAKEFMAADPGGRQAIIEFSRRKVYDNAEAGRTDEGGSANGVVERCQACHGIGGIGPHMCGICGGSGTKPPNAPRSGAPSAGADGCDNSGGEL